MPFFGPLEDRLAIRELYGRYADAACSGDGQAWLECWAEGCAWETPVGKVVGKRDLARQWSELWAGIETMSFLSEITAIEVSGDQGLSRAYSREASRWKDGRLVKVIGRYDDEIVRVEGIWLFFKRTFSSHLLEAD